MRNWEIRSCRAATVAPGLPPKDRGPLQRMGARRHSAPAAWRVDKVSLKRTMAVPGSVSPSEAAPIKAGDLGGPDTDRCWLTPGAGPWRGHPGWQEDVVSASGGRLKTSERAFCSLPPPAMLLISRCRPPAVANHCLSTGTGFSAKGRDFQAGSDPLLGCMLWRSRGPSGQRAAWQVPQKYPGSTPPGEVTLCISLREEIHMPGRPCRRIWYRLYQAKRRVSLHAEQGLANKTWLSRWERHGQRAWRGLHTFSLGCRSSQEGSQASTRR